MLKITDNVTRIEKEVRDGDFNLNLKDHILYLPSFISPDVCKDVVNNLKNVVQWIEKKSTIELLAIGIGHDVTRYYKNAIKITDVQDLGDVMIII